jgi:hypothetical protein
MEKKTGIGTVDSLKDYTSFSYPEPSNDNNYMPQKVKQIEAFLGPNPHGSPVTPIFLIDFEDP